MMAEQPKAKGGEHYHSEPTGFPNNPVPTLAQAGIDKNLAFDARLGSRTPRRIAHSAGPDRTHANGHRAGSLASWLAACKFGELGTMIARIAAHLLMEGALAALLATEPLPVAVDWERAAAFRIGTGPNYRLGRGLATGHGRSSGLVKTRWSAHFRGSARSKSEPI
jgi:hypothetical protein